MQGFVQDGVEVAEQVLRRQRKTRCSAPGSWRVFGTGLRRRALDPLNRVWGGLAATAAGSAGGLSTQLATWSTLMTMW